MYKFDRVCMFALSIFLFFTTESIGGPLLCANLGPSFIQELSPAFLRSRVGSEVTWSCEAVGGTSLKYLWLKNYQVSLKIESVVTLSKGTFGNYFVSKPMLITKKCIFAL